MSFRNEEQVNFNARIDEALMHAKTDLASILAGTAVVPGVQHAKKGIQEGWLMLKE